MDNYTDLSVELSTALGVVLKSNNSILALAESCTGGLASAAITDVAGSSTWFDRGFITYSNAAKESMLSVQTNTLETFGAVSVETALEMALGALANSHATIAASITGIAGPSGGSKEKPIGTVCFAWATKDGASTSAIEHFSGNRQAIRHQAVIRALSGLIDINKSSASKA